MIFFVAGKTDAERKIEELTRALEVKSKFQALILNYQKFNPAGGDGEK